MKTKDAMARRLFFITQTLLSVNAVYVIYETNIGRRSHERTCTNKTAVGKPTSDI